MKRGIHAIVSDWICLDAGGGKRAGGQKSAEALVHGGLVIPVPFQAGHPGLDAFWIRFLKSGNKHLPEAHALPEIDIKAWDEACRVDAAPH